MSLLSITFHSPEGLMKDWDKYVREELTVLADNLMEVEQYTLSEIHTEFLQEGKNYNLLLVFASEELRSQFLTNELPNIEERVMQNFEHNITVFHTILDPIKARYSN